ncbi:probetacellulin isoform X3 [Erinaceus europaeus]|uniref:Probetacellulin isoform X3 n=1 Tax=Erinaceus europaeus TaxID=9365 RepID=A0ABM3X4W7_ERIEU|nr:probetacellulin isoform X3 [Erinaceus europaeus]
MCPATGPRAHWGCRGWAGRSSGRAPSMGSCSCTPGAAPVQLQAAASPGQKGSWGPAAGAVDVQGPPGTCGGVRGRWRPLSGLVIFHCVVADGNSTRSPEHDGLFSGGSSQNCTAATTQSKQKGHFSRCPKPYKHYCINGRCRFVVAEQKPSCVCDDGYAGARCERVDVFYLRGDRGQILVICLIAVMSS